MSVSDYVKTIVKWHDITLDPTDLPAPDEPIIVTIEIPQDGTRKVWLDVFLKENDNYTAYFCTRHFNAVDGNYGVMEDTAIWYKVVAWAYPPNPYPV